MTKDSILSEEHCRRLEQINTFPVPGGLEKILLVEVGYEQDRVIPLY